MTRVTLRTIVIILTTFITQTICGQSLYPYLKNDLYGYADSSGQIIIAPKYTEVSNFGSSEIFSLVDYSNKNSSKDKHWPETLAIAFIDSLSFLLDEQGRSILGDGIKAEIQFSTFGSSYFYNSKSTFPYRKITTTDHSKGWGIWNNDTKQTDGLIYSYWSGVQSRYNSRSNDLNPFRSGMIKQSNGITGCDCTLAKRKDGTIDMISPFGELVQANIPMSEKEKWSTLNHHEKETLRNKELSNLCRYTSFKKESKNQKSSKKSGTTLESFLQRRQEEKDSIEQLTGKKYDEIVFFPIRLKEMWTCGLNKEKKRIDIINSQGKIVHKATASEIPKSIGHNLLWLANAVFVKSEKESVLLNEEGKTLFSKGQYSNILAVGQNRYFAFLKKDAPYPLHIYDGKWNRVIDQDIYGLTRSNTVLVKNKNGSFSCKKLNAFLGTNDPIDKGSYDLITFNIEKSPIPLQPKNYTPIVYSDKSGTPTLPMDYMAGLDDLIKSSDAPDILVSRIKQKNHRNRIPSKSPLFFLDSQNGKRLVATKNNLIYLDTIVDKLLHVKWAMDSVEVMINNQIKVLPLKNKKKSFFKEKIYEMYAMRKDSLLQLMSANDKIITTFPIQQSRQFSLRPQTLIPNRNLLFTSKSKGLILDDKGEVLETIDRLNPIWINTLAARSNVTSPIDFQIIDKTFLKVFAPKPYIINLKTMQVFWEK